MGLFDRWKKKLQTPSNPKNSPFVSPKTHDRDLPPASLAEHIRPAWSWVLSDGEAATDSSRIGGRPMMGEEEAWPHCGECKNPLTFMTQVNLDDLPDGMTGHESGVLRFFYCLHDDCGGMGGWEAYDPQHHLSILQGYGHCKNAPKNTVTIPARYISDFLEMQDVPSWPDRDDPIPSEADANVTAIEGHKFGGWPLWVQGAERPKCTQCQSTMTPFIQLDNHWTKEFNFGGGIGHISQCPIHTDVLAFGWAC